MGKRDLPEQQAFSYPEHQPIPPRRSATAEQLRARRDQYTPPIIRPGYDQHQRDTTSGQQYRSTRADYQPANPGRAGHHAGLHPEDAPYSSEEVAYTRGRQRVSFPIDIDETLLPDDPPRPPTSAIRYSNTAGNPKLTRDIYGEQKLTRRLPRSRVLKVLLLWVCIGIGIMLIGWLVFSAVGTWWTNKQNDWTYGFPRTYQTDAVVGHGDSPSHPSHFIALNLNRQVIVIEIPGGDASKAKIYIGPTLIGDGQELIPVTVSFEQGAKPGKPDMYLHIGDQVIVFLNDGQQFVAPPRQ
jgi:hypothetical protein